MRLKCKTVLIFILLIILLVLIALNVDMSQINISIIGAAEPGKSTIVWENKKVYSSDGIIHLAEFVEKNIKKFEPLETSELKQLNTFAKNNKIPVEQLISMRHIIATQNSINSKRKSGQYFNKIKGNYNANFDKFKSPKEISRFFQSYPVPPLEIIRMLKDNGTKIAPEVQTYAEKNDSENPKTYQKILKDADAFESDLVKWIKDNYPDIRFKTQAQLVEEQTTRFGKPFATPDILFDEPVLVKISDTSQLIRWIDAKNYTLIKVPFIMQSIHKQAEKYLQNYGPGALAFHYGITKDIHIPNVLMLDASFIP
jgi:hypothetical protein